MLECKVHAAKDLRVTQAGTPEPGPGDVLLRLGAAGICGSDIHYYVHGRVGGFAIREPLTPGHEASGVVVALGAGVTGLAPGDRVAIDPSSPCGRCARCRDGRENLCAEMRFLGSASVFPHVQGMFREYFVMPAARCHAVRTEVSLQEIAMSEPFSVALHSVRRAGNLLDKSVLITGGGTIGCMMVLAARRAGARHVAVADLVDYPLQVARAVGADQTIRIDRIEPGAAIETQAGEPDLAFEVSGALDALVSCLRSVRRGATIVQVGTLPQQGAQLPINLVMQRELDLLGSFRFGNVFGDAVAAIASRQVDLRAVISASHPLAEAAAAIELARDKSRSMKIHLVPG